VRLRRDDGQALLLALAFLFFGALVIGAMLTFAYSSASSTIQLEGQRTTVYAADGATDAAIEAGRVDRNIGGYGDPRCQETPPATLPVAPTYVVTTTTTQVIPAVTTNVICTWSPDPFQPDRTVIFTTFVSGGATPVVQAKVVYDDSRAAAGAMPTVKVLSWTYCGHASSC
jgi:hypothetical protein